MSVRATSKRLSVFYRMVRGVIGAVLGAFRSNVDSKGLQKNAAALHEAALKEITSKNCTLQVGSWPQPACIVFICKNRSFKLCLAHSVAREPCNGRWRHLADAGQSMQCQACMLP